MFDHFINVEAKEDSFKEFSNDELILMAQRYSVFQINRELKHYKAWLGGKKTYKYLNRTFPVLTGHESDMFHSDIQALDRGFKNSSLESKKENISLNDEEE